MNFFIKISNVHILIKVDNIVIFKAVKEFFSGYSLIKDISEKVDIEINIYSEKKIMGKFNIRQPHLFSYGRIKGYRLDNGKLLLSDQSTFVVIDETTNTADAYVDTSILKRGTEFVSIFLTITLIELLRHNGLYYLHAGAIKKKKHSILLCGMGMSGKTTLSIGLASKGYLLCSDDAVFLRNRNNRIQAIGFKKDIHVTNDTLHRYKHVFDDIKPAQPPFRKTSVPYRKFKTINTITPNIIIFLQRTGLSTTHVTPIGLTKAMSFLIPQSLMLFFNKNIADKHVAVLKALIHQTENYLCLCGTDLLEDPLIILKEVSKK